MKRFTSYTLIEQPTDGGYQPPFSFSPALPLAQARLYYLPTAAVAAADNWLSQLLTGLPWEAREIQIYGRSVMQPRLTAWLGDKGAVYTYSKTRHQPLPWQPPLIEIKAFLENLCACRFNSVLANLYRNGSDSMGWHSDNERELGVWPVIASLSLGGERRFVMRRKDNPRVKHEWVLAHGSVLVMAGATQRYWQHALPKTAKRCAPRVNLTFRWIYH